MPTRRLYWLLAVVPLTVGTAAAQVSEGPPPLPKLERPSQPPPSVPDAPVAAPPITPDAPKPDAKPRGFVAARVLARVNGHPVLFEEVLNASALELESIRPQVPDAQWPMVREEFLQRKLDEIITVEVLIQDAAQRIAAKTLEQVMEGGGKEFDKKLTLFRDRMKYPSEAATVRMFTEAGYSVDEMRRQFARAMVAFEYLRQGLMKDTMEMIDRQDMLEYYRENPKEFEQTELLTWQHIYLDASQFASRSQARAQAEQLQQLMISMQRREDFYPLARKHSHSPDRFSNGENSDPPGQIRPPEVLDMLLRMQPGQTSPVIEVSSGFHVVKLIEHQKGGMIPFTQACQDIKQKLQSKLWQKEFDRITKRLRDKATIEILAGGKE